MSATLSRRIRRIGILPTIYNESTEKRLVTEIVNGEKKEVEKSFKKRTPVRHRASLSSQERTEQLEKILSDYRTRNLEFRAKRKQARINARNGKVVKVAAPVTGKQGKKAA